MDDEALSTRLSRDGVRLGAVWRGVARQWRGQAGEEEEEGGTTGWRWNRRRGVRRPGGGEWEEKEDRAGRYLADRARVPSLATRLNRAPPFARPRAKLAAPLCSAAPSSLTPDSTTSAPSRRRRRRRHRSSLTLLSDNHL